MSGCFQEALSGADEILTALTGERPANNLIAIDIGCALVGNPATNTKRRQKLNQIASAFLSRPSPETCLKSPLRIPQIPTTERRTANLELVLSSSISQVLEQFGDAFTVVFVAHPFVTLVESIILKGFGHCQRLWHQLAIVDLTHHLPGQFPMNVFGYFVQR